MDSATYSASSRLQAAGLRPAITLFEEAARTVPLPRAPQPIAIADYGAANGYNSLLPIGARHRHRCASAPGPTTPSWSPTPTSPSNDFTALFATLAEDPDSYLKKDAATFASAVGRSFYTADPAVAEHRAGLELVGGALAEPGPDADPRPRPDLLQLG